MVFKKDSKNLKFGPTYRLTEFTSLVSHHIATILHHNNMCPLGFQQVWGL